VAFETAYLMANNHYASIAASLEKTQGVKTSEYRKLEIQIEAARAVRLIAKQALRVHKQGHKTG